MQTIYLDISNKSVIPAIHAKQGDVGRKFLAILSDGSVPYVPTNAPAFSVFYEGDSGSGNYTHIGDKPAFEINGNKVTVELIEQMVTNAGGGVICLVLNDADGAQLAFWNIEYYVEEVPGFDSEMAKEYYTAFSKAVENLPYPDATLTGSGKAADAKAVGDALNDKAPLSHITDTSNPHKVTAEQVGARTADWMPTAEDVGARPDDWMPSADDVGAIPAEEKGAASGVATLDENGKVVADQSSSSVIRPTDVASYTLSATDMGKLVIFTQGEASVTETVVTLPADAAFTMPVGSEIEISKWNGGLSVTIKCEDGVNIRTRLKNTLSQISVDGSYGIIALKRIADTKWYATGDIA